MVNRGEIVPAEVSSPPASDAGSTSGRVRRRSARPQDASPRPDSSRHPVGSLAERGSRLILVRARGTREVQVIVKPVAVSVDRSVACLSLRIALYGLVERGIGMIMGGDSPFAHGPDSPQDQPVMDRPVGEPVA